MFQMRTNKEELIKALKNCIRLREKYKCKCSECIYQNKVVCEIIPCHTDNQKRLLKILEG